MEFLMHKTSRYFIDWQTPPVHGLVALAALGLVGFLVGYVFQLGIISPYDKIVHGVFFLALAGALQIVLPGRISVVLAVAVALGAVSEMAQALTPFRYASFDDFLADLAGIMVFVAISAMVRTVRHLQPQAV